jgi:hypothetical protein
LIRTGWLKEPEVDDRKKVGKAIGAMITEAAKSLFLVKLTI